jgi:hypothetical protein
MITFFKGLLSSNKIVDNISTGLDKVTLTAQERTEHFLKYLELSMPMNISRRFIAMSVCINWTLYLWLVVFLMMTGNDKLEAIVSFGTVYIMPPFTVITGFYFWKRQA